MKKEELTVKRSDIWKIPPHLIFIETENIRDSYPEEKFTILKNGIKENGVLEAVHVRKTKDGRYALTHGFNRMRVVWELISEGHEILYVKACSSIINEEDELLQHLILNSGEPLSKYEISKILIKLKVFWME